jgi:hypothetical protein
VRLPELLAGECGAEVVVALAQPLAGAADDLGRELVVRGVTPPSRDQCRGTRALVGAAQSLDLSEGEREEGGGLALREGLAADSLDDFEA